MRWMNVAGAFPSQKVGQETQRTHTLYEICLLYIIRMSSDPMVTTPQVHLCKELGTSECVKKFVNPV